MNNSFNSSREIEIDLIDLIWKLLMQWKAILIVCLALSMLVPGAKYLKDNKIYKAELTNKQKADEEASKPADERIEEALNRLPSDQRDEVLFVVQQQDMVNAQKRYLNESILLNIDPASARQLSIKYLLKSSDSTDMRTLADAYSTCLHRNEFLECLRDEISPDTQLEYIEELIDTKNEDILAGDANSAIYTVTITLPDDADADSIVDLFDSTVNNLYVELKSAVGDHSIVKANIEDHSVFSKDIVDRRANLTYTINNLNSSIDSTKAKLSAEQQSACETIAVIKQSSYTVNEAASKDVASSSNPQKPGFSKKFAALGFLLGAFLYAGIYVVILVLKRVVASASTAQRYTDTRLLGEVYRKTDRKRLGWLLTSDIVAKWRFKDKLDVDKQISALAAAVDAVCTYHNTDKLNLMIPDSCSVTSILVDEIVEKCKATGNSKSIVLFSTGDMEEKELTSVSTAIYVVFSKSKVDKLGQLMSLIKDYNVTPLGTIYLEEI